MMKCKELETDVNIRELFKNIAYNDIFGSIEKQSFAIKAWKKIFKLWLLKLEKCKLSPSGRQVHQLPMDQSASYALASADQTVDTSSPDDDSISHVYDFG